MVCSSSLSHFLSFVTDTTPLHNTDLQARAGERWQEIDKGYLGMSYFCHCLLSDNCPSARSGNTLVVLEWALTLLNSLRQMWPLWQDMSGL